MPLFDTYLDRSSIRFQLLRLVAVVATAALVISLAGGMLFEWNNQQKQLRQSLVTIADAAGVAASAAVAFHDSKAADEALRILVARREITGAAIYPAVGSRLASYGDDAYLPRNADQLSEHLPSFSLLSAATTLFQPIHLDDSVIGYIYIRASLLDYRRSFLLQGALTIGVNLLALLLVLGFGLRFVDRIVTPVRELAETSRHIRDDKNFALRAPSPEPGSPHNEIGELVLSFNAMLAEIEQRESELAGYQKSLERMVLERTEALHAANAKLQAAKEAAEAATVAKSRFLAAASHDLRQPIQAIGLFQNALNRTGLDEEQKRISDYLALSVHSLGDLLNALLDISKLDAGAILARPRVIDVHDLASSIDAEFAPLALAKSLRFKLYFPAASMALFADRHLLQSLLRNLVGNALKYTEHGGVLVAVRRRGGQALIQVWDTGIGIAPEHIDTIFDEYFQVGNPERDNAKGLGLGLSIAKRQARLLETEISCRSRLGRGSVFEFRLPLADRAAGDDTLPGGYVVPRDLVAGDPVKRHVVVVEDDLMVAKALRLSLESLGLGVTAYVSAEEALADATIAGADFYISDFRLPGANGFELLEEIQRRATGRIKAVLMTGETSPSWIGITQSVPWPVLFKPVDLGKLMAAIESQSDSA